MPASVDLRASAGRTLRTGTAELAGRRVVHAQFDLSTRQRQTEHPGRGQGFDQNQMASSFRSKVKA